MSVALKLAGFAAVLVALFGVAAVAGGAIDPDRGSSGGGAHGADMAESEAGDGAAGGDGHGASGRAGADGDAHGAAGPEAGGDGAGDDAGAAGGDAHGGAHGAATADGVRGLAVADGGLRLVAETPELPARRVARLAFTIVDRDGRPVRDFDVEHERRMHLIVVRRDTAGFQHLHPRMAADGTWSTPIRLDEAGSYRMFADFSNGGEAHTLATDLRVDGDADLLPLPAPTEHAHSDGGDAVTLSDGGRPLRAGADATLRFTIERDGAPVELQPYLGAGGHLVALREGDLAFLHVHPTESAGDAANGADDAYADGGDHSHASGETAGGDSVAFETSFPTPGRYRLFLQYKVDGRVETVAFTVGVAR